MFKFDYDPSASQKSTGPTVLEPGKIDFKVRNAMPHTSKEGKRSLKLELAAVDSRNNKGIIFEYLSANAGWKVKAFLDSIGMPQLYTPSGAFDTDKIMNATGEAMIATEASTQYGDSSKVAKFLPQERDPNDQQQRQSRDADPFGDDIPFWSWQLKP